MPRPRKFDEQRVLELAREQFWATGYAGTRMDEIAEATGLGKGSLYGAFGDKSALFHRVFDDWCTAIVGVAEQNLAGDSDSEAFARLSAYVHLIAANTVADTGNRGCLLAKGAAELAQQDPMVATRSAETMTALLALLRTEIVAAQRNGDIDDGADPAQLAALLLAVLRGIEAVGKAGLARETVQGIADTALEVLPRPDGRIRPTIERSHPTNEV
ncbi:TetR/AcrR family transcriptional regulator [Streptomyces sp. NPDC002328]|uniref:TetR/AcrR family transcriptional regulator n=1 Tax=Streptomyces sp. NPDC002328 TaxID=3364642 RepID=UPI0036CE7D60